MIEATEREESAEQMPEAEQSPPKPEMPWGDVLPDHFRMLRLVPQPMDRATGARPLRFVQFGRVEKHSVERSLLRMEIQLPGQRLNKEKNRLDVWADHQTHVVSFQPDSGLQLEPANRGLGRFMIAQAVAWAQRRWSAYQIQTTALASKDGLNEDTRLRRDNVLKVHGFEVQYADPQHLKGSFKDVGVGALKPEWNGEKVQIVEILEAANMLQVAEQNLQDMENKLRHQEQHIGKYKRDDNSLRFTIACLVTFAVFQAGLLIWIATHHR